MMWVGWSPLLCTLLSWYEMHITPYHMILWWYGTRGGCKGGGWWYILYIVGGVNSLVAWLCACEVVGCKLTYSCHIVHIYKILHCALTMISVFCHISLIYSSIWRKSNSRILCVSVWVWYYYYTVIISFCISCVFVSVGATILGHWRFNEHYLFLILPNSIVFRI